ncbi:hypothetical protein [Oceanirhabdus seepicola]|uniref:Uncharacterized protein n=1 Tax=Oceanirhabdus seepicola TaxID=2828781 RepID=A0A9J6NYS0_9CLOT|nr:hypothetical protein [Oceanirhabdus seepicola]MCM1988296.1 hypothetical protein [Oceanirhabdus seepicola]
MLQKRRSINDLLRDLKDDFAWVEIKWTDKYGHYMSTINYIDERYTIDYKKVDYKEVKMVIKQAMKENKDVRLIRMKRDELITHISY